MTVRSDLPIERDLPPGVQAKLRDHVNDAIGPNANRSQLWMRVAAPVTLSLAVAAAVAVPMLSRTPGNTVTEAFGQGGVSARLERVIKQCEKDAYGKRVGITPGSLRLVNRGEAGDYAIAVFLAGQERMVVCDGSTNSGGGSYGPFVQAQWLPGPISVESASATELKDGDMFVAGRVSERVARVELDHGNGNKTVARLAEGTFAVATSEAHLDVDQAKLISYDQSGAVIDSRSPNLLDAGGKCYVDATNTVVYGKNGPDCAQAEPWH